MGHQSAKPSVWPAEDPEEHAGLYDLALSPEYYADSRQDLRESPPLQVCLENHGGLVTHKARNHRGRRFHAHQRELRRRLLRQ